VPADAQARLRVAVLGTGFGLSHHARAWAATGDAEVVAICSARPGRGQQVAADLPGVEGYDDWRRMLDDVRPDVLVIASRPDAHADPAIAALERGIHVLCEKPLAGDLDDGMRIARAAVASEAVFAVDFEFRFSAIRQAVRDAVAAGAIGEPRSLAWTVRYPSYDRLAAQPHGWLWEEAHGGGIARAIGSHLLDSLFWIAPLPWETGGLRWSSITEHAGTPSAADDAFTVVGSEPGGAGFAVTLTPTHGAFASELTIVGTTGTLVMDESAGMAEVHRGPEEFEVLHSGPASGPGTPGDDLRPRLAQLVEHFVSAVRGEGRGALPGIEHGIRVQAALESVAYFPGNTQISSVPNSAMKSEIK
jgi:predicted dehydrogenase